MPWIPIIDGIDTDKRCDAKEMITIKKLFLCLVNITFERHCFLMKKKNEDESVNFFNHEELADNCDLGDKNDSLFRDVFNANRSNC